MRRTARASVANTWYHVVNRVIGNSQGICIPKPLLEQTGLCGEVEICAQDDTLIVRPARRPRAGWAAAFREMARRGDDALVDDEASNPSNRDEDD
jgi:antitoxin MazE